MENWPKVTKFAPRRFLTRAYLSFKICVSSSYGSWVHDWLFSCSMPFTLISHYLCVRLPPYLPQISTSAHHRLDYFCAAKVGVCTSACAPRGTFSMMMRMGRPPRTTFVPRHYTHIKFQLPPPSRLWDLAAAFARARATHIPLIT